MIAVHDVARITIEPVREVCQTMATLRINITTKGGETIRIELMSDAAANLFPITKE